MRKLELLSPAGDMERLKMAVLYGADADCAVDLVCLLQSDKMRYLLITSIVCYRMRSMCG